MLCESVRVVIMAFLLHKSSIAAHLRSHFQVYLFISFLLFIYFFYESCLIYCIFLKLRRFCTEINNQKTEDPVSLSRRRLHVEPGAREKAVRNPSLFFQIYFH